MSGCESPIEELFYAGLCGLCGLQSRVIRQHPIGRYRVDFLIVAEPYTLVIECDGHEFHSSPDQIRRDRQREREIIDLGYSDIIRFSGAQIYRSLHDCLAVVEAHLDRFGIECKRDSFWPLFWPELAEQVKRDRQRERRRIWENGDA